MPNPSTSRRVAVVGGGISGLAAAYTLARLRQSGAPIEEILFESSPRLGGVICSERTDGFLVEGGPDSFLAEKPQAAAMARELGLASELMGSNDHARRTYILHRGRLLPLPDGLMFLVPTRVWPMVTTRLLPLSAKLAAAQELFQSPPPPGPDVDEAVASFVERHFGQAMVDNIADPLLAGVYGGDTTKLSVRSVLPRFWQMEQRYGSLTRATLHAMRQRRSSASGPDSAGTGTAPSRKLPLFMTLRGGLEQITTNLAAPLDPCRVLTSRRVLSIEFSPSGPGGLADSCARRFHLICGEGSTFDADAVILALPAYLAGGLVETLDRRLGTLLEEIPYTSAMTVSLGFDESARAALPTGFGFLVPRKEGRRMLACTFVHAKFDHRAPESKAMLRCFLGGARDPQVLGLTDQEVISLARSELKTILNFSAEPLFYRVHRWPAAMAQYPVGHADRLTAIDARLRDLPGVYLAGNAYSGIGISDCIRTGRAAVTSALQYLGLNKAVDS